MQLIERFVAHGISGSFRGPSFYKTSLWFAALCVLTLSPLQSVRAQGLVQTQANGKIAYSDVIERGNGYEKRAIFIYPGNTQLTHPAGPVNKDSDTAPAWSPDGTKIAWVRYVRDSDQSGQWTIMIADADGSNERLMMRQRNEDGTPTGDFANCTPGHITWSPDGTSIAFGASCRQGGSTYVRDFIHDINAPANQYNNFTNMNLRGNGLDWSPEGVVHSCFTFNVPANLNPLFCVWKSSADIKVTALEIDTSNPVTQGSVVVGSPRWRYSLLGPRATFIFLVPNANSTFPAATTIYSIEPSRSSQQPVGASLNRNGTQPEYVACTNGETTNHLPRYTYHQIAPSPDGKYIAARRTETRIDPGPNGGCAGYTQINNGIYILRPGGIVQNTAALGNDVIDPAWQPSPANLIVTFKDGLGRELHGMKVELLDFHTLADTGKIPTNTAGGQYLFEGVIPNTYRVRATLQDIENSAFDIRYDYIPGVSSDAAVNADFRVVIEPDADQVARSFRFSGDQPGFESASVDELKRTRLAAMATIYYNFAQFVSWVKASLTSNLGTSRVAVHAFATSDPNGGSAEEYGAAYFADKNRIILAPSLSPIEQRDDDADECPINCEYHEYAHHIDYLNRGSGFACFYDANDSVHGGYANSSTCDSLREGIATFLPTMYTSNPDYAGMFDLEDHTKAWHVGFGEGNKRYAREDFAVAAVLWDLVDSDADVLFTSAITPGASRLHVPVAYPDNIALPLTSLWQILGSEQPSSVRDLQQYLDSVNTAALLDLDNDTIADVSSVDPLFLMHGFYPTLTDRLPGNHAYHYDIGRARAEGEATNADVGLSSHFAFNLLGLTGPDRLYREHHPSGDVSYLGLGVRDASGTPLSGADVYIDLHYPGSDQRLTRHLASGEDKLVRLQLPQYFDYLPVDGTLPECDPVADSEHYVSVTVTAELNGYPSNNTASFDNCQYLAARLNAPDGTAALSYTLEFPEDSVPPTTTAQTFGTGQVSGSNATESWAVQLVCTDPEVSGFASGCNRSEYSINGGPVQTYEEGELLISGDGDYLVEFYSYDAASNQEPAQQIQLTIGTPPPGIPSFTPASGPVGAFVQITGTDFIGVTAVKFNGTDATFTVSSSTLIYATVPAGATSGPISVTGPGGTTSSAADFTVLPTPSITNFTPAFGAVGASVILTGSNFSGVTYVAFNGVPAVIWSTSTANQIVTTVPVGATTGPITVQTPGGTATSQTNFVVTNGLPPSITSFSPTNGAIGSSVTIKGSNLTGATTVTFNGVAATFRYKGSAIVATVPAGATTGPIRVTTAGGWTTSAGSFVVNLPPVIQSISPTSGPVGSTVTLTGSNFTGASAVKFGKTSASFVVVSASTITATVPGRAKTAPISIATPGGTAVSATSFTVVP